MIDLRRRALHSRRRGEAALVLGEGVGIEHVLARHVLDVNERVGARDLLAEPRVRMALAGAVIGMARRFEIGAAQFVTLAPVAALQYSA